MNAKAILKGILSSAINFLDTDKDGKLEIADLPGALANIASVEAQGRALVAAAGGIVGGLKGLAQSGRLTSMGTVVTIEEIEAKYASFDQKVRLAGSEARELLAQDPDEGGTNG